MIVGDILSSPVDGIQGAYLYAFTPTWQQLSYKRVSDTIIHRILSGEGFESLDVSIVNLGLLHRFIIFISIDVSNWKEGGRTSWMLLGLLSTQMIQIIIIIHPMLVSTQKHHSSITNHKLMHGWMDAIEQLNQSINPSINYYIST